MAFLDYLGGQGFSGHDAPNSTQTNPNNDPTIAASQEQLRQFGTLDRSQLTNPRITGTVNMGTGDMPNYQQTITYDSPYGPVTAKVSLGEGVEGMAVNRVPSSPPLNAAYSSGAKFWWNEGLAEPVEFRFGEDGKVTSARPRDTRYSFGEQLGDFAGNLATMALSAYGLNYAAGAVNGAMAPSGVGTANMSAGELAAMDAAGGSMAGTGLPAAGVDGLATTTAAANGVNGALNSSVPYSDTAGLEGLVQNGLTTAGPNGVGTGAATSGTQAFMNQVQNWLTNGGQGGVEGLGKLLLDNGGDLLRNGGQLALMREMYNDSKGNAEEWRNFMRQGTPDLGFFQGKLRESFENPASFLEGPQFQASQRVVHNQLQRADAAGGRLANDIGRQKILQDHAMGGLQNFQNGLGQLVNQQQNTATGQGASNALQQAQGADADWMRNLMNWMSGK